MFNIIFFFLMGLVSPSQSGQISKCDAKGDVTVNSRPAGGPGGETGNNRPR